ncbi:hypothetical protein HRR83_007892 [Exophiala dermatitidis]|uniref:Oxysterol-binding protein n=2 Tax=Exophiala dermatitidis TaxID=5970 RepID=H6BUA0_EXODN|nr:uncharacterized protein HMPREF1120_03803 [Exophiala dermatitidis NIH/UT8656]KAJ4508861.1 hypothetical protein HRR74_007453 [Exophiala dermatitidis]EHY55677.1 hypothetical protein HMPREF1120_03803 [Exophiala dermatitidis NIH/UT8656]KAJ4510113.1 hypothetical protein HRR73_006911 [Exophiala dermatitidis]KAJ4539116.1 hypothetical protein HRR77_006532 [Exophiala dermatitidis]KAJ4540603.1 hypothetical protein HRR76_003990 [Exophiala dermatitidis]
MPEQVTELQQPPAAPSLAQNRSRLKDFVASVAVIRGDLSNITAPPFVLDTKSAVELPAFWAERPAVFVAPASSDDPAERAVLVLKWFLASLRNQQYAGRRADEGVKKPLNAFLGELFLATWNSDAAARSGPTRLGTTRLVSEQVSHHPPVTACRVWNEEHGVSAEGYTRQEITFSTTMNIRQFGHATFHLAKHNETYLIPLPDVKIKGVFSGSPYPELQGTYRIPSTSGITSSIQFGGTGFLSGFDKSKHAFEAKVYRDDDGNSDDEADNKLLYTVRGNWDRAFTIHDTRKGVDVATFDVRTAATTPLTVDPLSEQDPWESRRAWRDVREALERGNMHGAADAKSKLEKGQRDMRNHEAAGSQWKSLFYEKQETNDPVTQQLARKIGKTLDPADTLGVWKFRLKEWQDGKFKKPYHGALTPDCTNVSGIERTAQ